MTGYGFLLSEKPFYHRERPLYLFNGGVKAGEIYGRDFQNDRKVAVVSTDLQVLPLVKWDA